MHNFSGYSHSPVRPGADLIHHRRLQIHKDGPGHVLSSPGLGEEGVEGVVPSPQGLVGGHLPVGLDAMLQAVELPAGVANLAAGLANVDRDALTLKMGDHYENGLRYYW